MKGPLSAFHPSNTLTYASLTSAIGAIAAAAHGNAAAAGACMAAAVIADTFDGRFARLFRRDAEQRALGAQLDSLADAIAFGAAPCLCMMLLNPRGGGWAEYAWWGAFALFAACAITRLAFFNVTATESNGFVGIPAPVAALIWASLALAAPAAAASALATAGIAAAIVLPVRIPRPTGLGLMLFAAWPLAVLIAHLRSML